MTDVFVSYASEDRERVRHLVQDLERAGWDVWWDREIGAGTAFEREIEKVIDQSRCILVVWSEAALESDWVRNEAAEGLRRKVLVPAVLDGVRPPLAFRHLHNIDLAVGADASDAALAEVREAVARLVPLTARGAYDTPFVGRSQERSKIQTLVEGLASGTGASLLLSGEAGVGKTRLAAEVAALAAARNVIALTGNCSDAEGAPPYQPLIEQIERAIQMVPPENLRAALGENAPEIAKLMPELRQLFPDIGAPVELAPEQERRYLLHGVADFIARGAATQPMLLVFEDLHWADDSTCLLLRHLCPRVREWPVLILGTYREEDLDPDRPFADTLQDLLRQRVVEDLLVGRLGREEVARMIEARAGTAPPAALVDLVFAETEGNAFFVEEVYRHLLDTGKLLDDSGAFRTDIEIADTEVPRGVRLVIGQRLKRVSDTCRQVLTAGAVIGRAFPFELLRASGVGDDAVLDAVEEGEAASLIRDMSHDREASYEFVHEQIRQTLLSSLSFPRRQRLHLRVAEALEQYRGRHDANRDAGEIAHHLYQAGAAADPDKTAEYLELAGDRALTALAFEDALRQLDLALEAAELDAAARARIHGKRGHALRGASRIDEALTAFGEGIASARDDGDDTQLVLSRCELLVDLYRGTEAIDDLESLLDRARADGDRRRELEAQLLLAKAYYGVSLDDGSWAQQYRDAQERAIELARELDERSILARGLLSSSFFTNYWPEYTADARSNFHEAWRIARELGDDTLELDILAQNPRLSRRLPGVRAEDCDPERILERLEARRDPVRLNRFLFSMMWYTYRDARPGRCIEVCERGIEVAERLGEPPVQYPTIRSFALTDLGRFDDAAASLDGEVADEAHPFGAAFQQLGRLELALRLGLHDRVLEIAETLFPQMGALNRIGFQQQIMDALAEIAAQRNLDANLLERLSDYEAVIGRGPNLPAQIRLRMAEGRAEQALDLLKPLYEASMRSQQRHRLRLIACDLSVPVLGALGRWDEALARVDEGLSVAERGNVDEFRWRLLARRASASDALDRAEAAATDRAGAREVLDRVAATISGSDLRESYLTQTALLGL